MLNGGHWGSTLDGSQIEIPEAGELLIEMSRLSNKIIYSNIYISVSISISLSLYLYLSIYLSVCLSIYLSTIYL